MMGKEWEQIYQVYKIILYLLQQQIIQMKPKTVRKTDSKAVKNKSQSKRVKTYTSSQFSVWEQKNKMIQSSATDEGNLKASQLLTNRKLQNNSILSQHINVKGSTQKTNLATIGTKTKKKAVPKKSKMKIKKIDEQSFQQIKYKESNSQSEIVFSNDETKRESLNKKPDTNLKLRINIRKEYQRKVDAVIKIQKIYRGYRIRKLIDKIILKNQHDAKHIGVNNWHSEGNSIKQNDTHRTFVEQQAQIMMNRLFENKAMTDIHFNHTMRPRVEEYSSSDDNQQHSVTNNFFKYQEDTIQKQLKKKEQIGRKLKSQKLQPPIEENQMYYKHESPTHQKISNLLLSQNLKKNQQQINETYEPYIIYQTNEEHIENRKTSLQNKKETNLKFSIKGVCDWQKLVGNGDIDSRAKEKKEKRQTEFEEKNKKKKKIEEKFFQQKSPQKIEQVNLCYIIQNKQKIQNQEKLIIEHPKYENAQTIHRYHEMEAQHKEAKTKNNEELLLTIYEKMQNMDVQMTGKEDKKTKIGQQKVKAVISPRYNVKYLQQEIYSHNNIGNDDCSQNKSNNSGACKKQIEQQEILKLREEECGKWQEVIRMVSQQIKKSQENNGEMKNFMQSIMDFSQKNKELLGSTRSVLESDNFTTPTSLGIVNQDKFNIKQKICNGKQQMQITQQPQYKFFKKKKPLKIDVAESNQLKGQKELFLSSEYKQQEIKEKQQIASINKNEINPFKKVTMYNIKKQSFFNTNHEKNAKISHESCQSRKLKKYLSSNIQVQDSAIYDILKLREQLLQKRQSEELIKLNMQLNNKEINSQQFIEKLSEFQKKIKEEKQIIDKSRKDIVKGYQAANEIVKEYFFDARKLGIKLAVSRSQDNLKYKFTQPSRFIADIKIDELSPKLTPKPATGRRPSTKQIFQQYEIEEERNRDKSSGNAYLFSSSQDSSIDFTQQQLRRLRKAANYDLQFNDLNRNMTTISDQFIRQQKKCFNDEPEVMISLYQSPISSKFIRGVELRKQMYHLQQEKTPSSRAPPHVDATIEDVFTMLIWQFSCELLIKPSMSDKLIERPNFIKPQQMTNKERLDFLKILSQNLPSKESLHIKLNQSITPTPSEILKCMHFNFSQQNQYQQNEEDNEEQISKYQFVISQQSCSNSIMLFQHQTEQIEEQNKKEQQQKFNQIAQHLYKLIRHTPIADKINKFINQRQKFIHNNKQHSKQLKREVLNTELHCIFDSWNEQIIQICSIRAGFSGIGLNQLSLSVINHNKFIPQNMVQQIIEEGKKRVIQILTDQNNLYAKTLSQIFHELCEVDSAWIFYADEALNCALEFVYLIEQDLYVQTARQLRKIIIKSSFSI